MLDSLHCPHGLSEHLEDHSVYETKSHGRRKLYRCIECQQVFSETKGTFLEGLKKPDQFDRSRSQSTQRRLGFQCGVSGL